MSSAICEARIEHQTGIPTNGEVRMLGRSSLRVLIAGGGVAALEAALALRALAADRVSVELLAPEPEFWYRPLAVAEPFGLGEVRHFDLPELAVVRGCLVPPRHTDRRRGG
jgi:hypothetical protein